MRRLPLLLIIFLLFPIIILAEKENVSSNSNDEKTEVKKPMNLFNDDKIRLVIRVDDIGFCHAANMAFKKIAEEGCVSAASVMVNTPWLDEAVEILKEHPEISVGVHTCLNSEWTPYRWGPVLPYSEVPTLVDEWGKFFPTCKQFRANNPNVDEVEKELRAQVDLALKKGLKVSYIDHHMGAAVQTPEMKKRFTQIAKDYGLAVSRWFSEVDKVGIYDIDPDKKADVLVKGIGKLKDPGIYLTVCHPGMNTPEMAALKDVHPHGLKNMSVHREAETMALCDPRLKKVIEEKNIELIGYDILREKFLDKMKIPY